MRLKQLINPEEFLSKVRLLYKSTDENKDILYFKDGRIYERYSMPLIMDDSSVGRVWSFRDITERMQTEAALRESESQFKGLIEKSIVGVYLIQDGLFRYVNARFEEMLGYSAKEPNK